MTTAPAPTTVTSGGCWDADRTGQVLAWAPQGAGDFADLAWVVAQLLGNGAGVRGLEVRRKADGTNLYANVTVDDQEYVEQAAAAHGLHLHQSQGYANAWGYIGDVTLDLTWIDLALREASS